MEPRRNQDGAIDERTAKTSERGQAEERRKRRLTLDRIIGFDPQGSLILPIGSRRSRSNF
jgi:hypothetical protein